MVLCQPEPVVLVYQSKAAQGDIYTLVRENKQNKSEKKKKEEDRQVGSTTSSTTSGFNWKKISFQSSAPH